MTVPFDLKEFDEEKGIFRGYGSVFNNVDAGKDRMLPGAFTKTLITNFNRIKILVMHKSEWLPIGIPVTVREDAKGLFVEGKISDTSMGKDVKILIKDGVFTELSIGYVALDFDYDGQGVRNLKEVQLYEVSPVIWAMNDQANITDFKNHDLGGEEPMKFDIGIKALSFDEVMSLDQLDDMKWKLQSALREATYSILSDDNMNGIQKVAAIDTTLNQFHLAMMEVYKRIIDIMDNQQKSYLNDDLLLKAKTLICGLKASELSAETQAILDDMAEPLTGLVSEPEQGEEEESDEDKEKLTEEQEAELINELKSLSIGIKNPSGSEGGNKDEC